MAPHPTPYGGSRAHAAHYLACGVAAVCCAVLLWLAAREARGVLARRTEGVLLVGTVAQRRAGPASLRGKGAVAPERGAAATVYTAVAAFQGRSVRVTNRFRSSADEYQAGDQVPIVYVPRRPEHSRWATPTEQYGQLLQLAGFGLLTGFAAALLGLRQLTVVALLRSHQARAKPRD